METFISGVPSCCQDELRAADLETPIEPAATDSQDGGLISSHGGQSEEAESRLVELRTRLAEMEKELSFAKERLVEADTRRTLQRHLIGAHAIDVDAAMLLAENLLKEGARSPEEVGERGLLKVVEDLRRKKPALFRSPVRSGSSSMAPGLQQPLTPISSAAEDAMRTGRRSDVLRYLRLRRGR